MKIKRYIKNILQVTLITCILFQICTYNIINVFANDISDIEDFPRKRSVVYNGKISYGDNIVGDFTIILEKCCIMGGKGLNNGMALKVVRME